MQTYPEWDSNPWTQCYSGPRKLYLLVHK